MPTSSSPLYDKTGKVLVIPKSCVPPFLGHSALARALLYMYCCAGAAPVGGKHDRRPLPALFQITLSMSKTKLVQWYQSGDIVTASLKLRQLAPSETRGDIEARFEEQYCAVYEGGTCTSSILAHESA